MKKTIFDDKKVSPISKEQQNDSKNESLGQIECKSALSNAHRKSDTDDDNEKESFSKSLTSDLNNATNNEEKTTTIEAGIKIVLSKSSDKIEVQDVSAAAYVSSSDGTQTTTDSVEIEGKRNEDQEESSVALDIKTASLESPIASSTPSRKRRLSRTKSRKRISVRSDSSLVSSSSRRNRSTPRRRKKLKKKRKTSPIKSKRSKRNAPVRALFAENEATVNDTTLTESKEEDFDVDQAFWKLPSPKRETIVDDSDENVSIFDDRPMSPDSKILSPSSHDEQFEVARLSNVFQMWGRFLINESLSYSQMQTDRSRSLGRALIYNSLFTPLQRYEQESMFLRGYRHSSCLNERFSPIKLIKHGAFSEVLLVKDREIGRQAIQKNVYVQKSDATKNAEAILKEKDILEGLKSHWIIKCHSLFRANRSESVADFFAFVMEYVPGGNWNSLTEYFHADVVKTRLETRSSENIWFELINSSMEKSMNSQTGRGFWEDVRFLCRQLICAVKYLHECGIHYCDLRPTNVLIDVYGHVKLTNFGLFSFLRRIHTNNKFRYMGICETEQLFDENLRHQYNHVLNRAEDSFHAPQETLFDLEQSFSIAKEVIDMNTWYWSAPECIDESYAKRFLVDEFTSISDWWSVGCMIFQISVGVPPFNSFLDMEPQDVFEDIVSMSSVLLHPENLDCILPYNQIPHAFARELIEGLLKDPLSRLGYNTDENENESDLLRMNFFHGFNENDMINYRMMARVEDKNAIFGPAW